MLCCTYLCMLKHPCIPGINPAWSRLMLFLIFCWIWFSSILRIFTCVHHICVYGFPSFISFHSFFVYSPSFFPSFLPSFLPSFFLFKKQGLAVLPKLSLNSRSSCLSLLSAGITGVHHHAWL
jgi:hypothetical protein